MSTNYNDYKNLTDKIRSCLKKVLNKKKRYHIENFVLK